MDTSVWGDHIYIVGIKGQGMAALALVLQGQGIGVEGSDGEEQFSTDAVLAEHGIPIDRFDAPLPQTVTTVLHSTAYDPNIQPQLQEAKVRGIPVMSYPMALGYLLQQMEGISIAGTHGKTTTTTMVGQCLIAAGKDPTVVVGSPVAAFHGNARIGRSNLLVVETDEYQDKLRDYFPRHIVITNIEYDHPDFFPTFEEYEKAFFRFVEKSPKEGSLVVSGDDPAITRIVQQTKRDAITFGKMDGVAYRLLASEWHVDHEAFRFLHDGQERIWKLPLPGEHNALNALACIALCRAFDVSWDILQQTLAALSPIARRFESLGEFHGAQLIDDFAHHPTEIAASIAGARQRFPNKRIVVAFQPHTYSRTKALLDEFAASLTGDENIVLDITSSARETEKTVHSVELVKKIPIRYASRYLPGVVEATAYLRTKLSDQDVVLLLGAGEQWRVAQSLRRETNV